MNGTDPGRGPDDPRDQGEAEGAAGQEPLLWRVVRSAIAPPVLRDGGHDAPMSARGRILFWGSVGILVVAITVLFVLTLTR